jgi:hypothetical protein
MKTCSVKGQGGAARLRKKQKEKKEYGTQEKVGEEWMEQEKQQEF